MSALGETCKHGQLHRQCEICELEEQLATMTKERDEWKENTKSLLREKSVLDGVIESLKDLLRISSQESEK